ncbi:MAG: hypothetical protein KGL95_00185, partial [Patescibacteria group bacterium]|nr:hypothetical protein [Patescibacteria group bacterium]
MWSNFTKIEKIASITLGLLALIGLTAYVSGGSNGQKIFSTAITLIFVIIGGSFIILKIKQERQYKNHNTSHYYEQYENKNNKQRNESNQRQREEEQWNRQKREEERGQRENEEQERQREEAYEQQENYSEQKNLNPEILEYYHILNLKPGSS